MQKKRNYYSILIVLACFLSIVYISAKIYGINHLDIRILSLSTGSSVLLEPSIHHKGWAAKNLIDGKYRKGWRSKENSPFPHIFVFELAANATIDLLKFKNLQDKPEFPETSAKEVRVEFSTASPHSGYINIGTFTLEKGNKLQEFSIHKTKARWIRLSIKSNHGDPHFTELMEFEAYGIFEFRIFPIISNFIWILGASIILAAFSYHAFLAHVQRIKRTEIFKRQSFMKPLLLGLVLAGLGISTSIHKLWIAATAGGATILLTVWFFKVIKKQTRVK